MTDSDSNSNPNEIDVTQKLSDTEVSYDIVFNPVTGEFEQRPQATQTKDDVICTFYDIPDVF